MILIKFEKDTSTEILVVSTPCQEIWNSPYSNASFPVYAEDIDAGGDASPSTMMLSELSRSLQITVVGGSIPERSDDKLYNTCCVFGSDGKLKAKHRKVCASFILTLLIGRTILTIPKIDN